MQEYVINIMKNYDEIVPVSSWAGIFELVEILIKYYSKKFKNSCIFQLPRVGWFTSLFDNYIPTYISYDAIVSESETIQITILKGYIHDAVSNISKCIQEKGKNISIAILYSFMFLFNGRPTAHRNVLIFKPYVNTLEWFEPLGSHFIINEFKLDISNQVLFNYLIKCLQEDETIDCKSIKFIKPRDICPNVGLQGNEQQSKLPDFSGGGYCALWSILITKLSLKYPYKTMKTIVHNLLEQYKDPDQLRKLMYAFSNEISDILLKHYKMPLNEMIDRLHNKEIIPIKSFKSTVTTSQSD